MSRKSPLPNPKSLMTLLTHDLNDTLDHKGEEAHTCIVHVNLLEINMIELPDVLFLLCTPKGLMQQEQVLRGAFSAKSNLISGVFTPVFHAFLPLFPHIMSQKRG